MKYSTLMLSVLLVAALSFCVAREAMARHKAGALPPIIPPKALYIVQNPGKDGELWFVRFGDKLDFNRMVRVKDQAEAEKMVALLLETGGRRYVFAGQVTL